MNPILETLDELEQLNSAQQGVSALIGDADLGANQAQNVSILLMLLDDLRTKSLIRLREQVRTECRKS